jgi:hypothetical protein
MLRELKTLADDSEPGIPGQCTLVRPFAVNTLNKALEGLMFEMDAHH